jgi:uroporphyrinogen-III synthase
MAVVITRPLQEAQRWADRLRRQRLDPLVLPLLAIGPPPDPGALAQAAAQADRYSAVMFVSANAVQGFFAASPAFHRARAWAPGPATREALEAAGVPHQRIDTPVADAAQFDSESLWQQVGGQLRVGDRLLLVRGGDSEGRGQGRDWLTRQLAAAGVQVDTTVAYARHLPTWSEEEIAAARASASDGSVWLFSSSEAAANLARLLPGQNWRQARALATHPRIADAVRILGFGEVRESRPGFEEVLASIESRR